MTLNETLQQIKSASRARVPAEAAAVMQRSAEQLQESGIVRLALEAGKSAPAFELPDATGNIHSSKELLKRGPLILNFYRGSW